MDLEQKFLNSMVINTQLRGLVAWVLWMVPPMPRRMVWRVGDTP
jgi:hypothetical protein